MERKPLTPATPASRAAEVLSLRIQRELRLKFQAQMIAEGREQLTPFILECAIDGLEGRILRASMEAYRRRASNTR